MKGRVRKRQKNKENLHLLIHSPKSQNGQVQVSSKQEERASSKSPIWVGDRGSKYWAIFHCMPRCIIKELDWQWNSWTQTRKHIDPGIPGNSLPCYTSQCPPLLEEFINLFCIQSLRDFNFIVLHLYCNSQLVM